MIEANTIYLWQMPRGVDTKGALRFGSGRLNQQHSPRYGHLRARVGFFSPEHTPFYFSRLS